jgi:ABC-type transport system involved in multi-copper enzyme maturation permease subunit
VGASHFLQTKLNFTNMKNRLNKMLFGFFIIIIITGCSARKTQTNVLKEESNIVNTDNSVLDKKSENNVKKTSVLNIDDKNEIVSKEEIYEPIDPLKEASVTDSNGNKTILNNSKKTTKTVNQRNNIQTKLNTKSDVVENKASKEQKKVNNTYMSKIDNKSKLTDKKAFNWFNLLFLILPLALLYYLFKKYREKLWWI